MLRKFVVTLFILICFVLQSTVFDALSFAGIIPNLMIILTASFGFMRGEREGLIIGFACGFLSDIFFGNFLGFYAILLMYIGYLILIMAILKVVHLITVSRKLIYLIPE